MASPDAKPTPLCRPVDGLCNLFSGGREGYREASPSLVYGAALLMRLGVTPPPGFKSRSLRCGLHRKVETAQLNKRP